MSGMYTTLSGLVATERSLESVAQNVANASTPGYRAQFAVFEEALTHYTDTPAVRNAGIAVDHSRGALAKTGNALDLALDGEGYFVIETQTGRYLTRDGRFRLNNDGVLVNRDGHPVVGQGGQPIEVPPDSPTVAVSRNGVLTADGQRLGQVLVVNVAPEDLIPAGSRFTVTAQATLSEISSPTIEAGMLEGSNFDAVRGMVELIRATRAHEALTRTLMSQSETEQRTARGISGT